jgi:hypothetical protein
MVKLKRDKRTNNNLQNIHINTRTVESRMTSTYIITLYIREVKNIYQKRNLVELIVTIISWS